MKDTIRTNNDTKIKLTKLEQINQMYFDLILKIGKNLSVVQMLFDTINYGNKEIPNIDFKIDANKYHKLQEQILLNFEFLKSEYERIQKIFMEETIKLEEINGNK